VKFALVDAEKAQYPVATMCQWLDVSRSGYYAWLGRKETPSAREREDAALLVEIRAVYRQHRRRYGAPRVFRALRASGRHVGRKRVERLMRRDGLRARAKSRFIITTDSRGTTAPAPNRLARDFRVRRPNHAWVGDVTYVPTRAGWVYLAVLLDLGSRRVVGWSTSRSNDTELALAALRQALACRRVRRRMLHHTDRGTPYASFEYQAVLREHGILTSMSRRGDCWDNAVAESFFSTLKCELDLNVATLANQADANKLLAHYIDGYYNTQRLHSSLGYITPIAFETRRAA
jgi:transposase InsO family protein